MEIQTKLTLPIRIQTLFQNAELEIFKTNKQKKKKKLSLQLLIYLHVPQLCPLKKQLCSAPIPVELEPPILQNLQPLAEAQGGSVFERQLLHS